MNKKNLIDKAIDIKGKKYILVSDRVLYFSENYPEGSIMTEVLTPLDSALIVVKATIKPVADDLRAFTGHSQAIVGDGYINKTSALENAESSAVGRALAMMGIGVVDSIASVDEINKTTHYKKPLENKNVEKFMEDLEVESDVISEWKHKLEISTTLKQLRDNWKDTPPLVKDLLTDVKDELKIKLGGK